MKPPGACGPASPAFSGAERRRWALAARTSPCSCAYPAGVVGLPQQLFTIQRQKTKSRSNSETKNPFPSRHPFLSLPPQLCRPLAPVSPPGACTSLPAPGPGACLPVPSPPARGRHPHTQRCFCLDGCAVPLRSCFLHIDCFWESGLGKKGLISHLGRLMGEGK